MLGEVLASPYTWATFAICVLGGWYAKRCLVDGIIVGGIASLILVPVWIVAGMALIVPRLIVELVYPGFGAWVGGLVAGWPFWATLLVHPATGVTGVLFFLYCRAERENSGAPAVYTPYESEVARHNVLSRRFRG
ncbi:MAG: hypothetical protein AAF591_05625 [Verrucomicrobiota bacterium]